ncbi:hypothetical protein HL653_22545 [Sphingomonas sp. AP4-R1]|uniref:sensor histidine kinase n=1 Tax=Sphingomonas sp. AP4-R1 TaxID=2735134 RepID=UPI001493DD81|nr:sensor histidine kinase [Sphingomonas sp. AP4-R1]QJU60146.1 hypothetical protein HL653_22545 [Sphingomonas sp. AP4-R1]
MRLSIAGGALLLAAAILLSGKAEALNPERPLSAYKHARWTAAEGAPLLIYALTQDDRGYLIIGSATGLYRFDGLTFDPIPTEDREIRHGRVLFLLKARDGTIWVAYDTGQIATYRDGILRLDRSAPRMSDEPNGMVQTRGGAIWLSQQSLGPALLRYQRGQWKRVTPDYDRDEHTSPRGLFAGRDGALWLATDRSLYVLREGAIRFERVTDAHGRTVLSEDGYGRLWISDDRGTRPFLPIGVKETLFPTPLFRRWTAVTRFDRDGNLWIANGEALIRVRSPATGTAASSADRAGRIEAMTTRDGLTANTTTPLFEDREGNVWMGTSRGLDQFRDVSIVNEPALVAGTGRSVGLLAASDGTVYAGAAGGLYRIVPGGRPERVAGPLVEPRLVCEAAGGDIWAMGNDAFVHFRDGVARRVPLPAPFRKLGSYDMGGCIADGRGTLWVSRYWAGNPDSGLFALRDGRWRHLPLSPDDWPRGLDRTAAGGVVAWLRSGVVGPMDGDGKVGRSWVTSPLTDGHVIQATHGGIVLGGKFGLARIAGGTLRIIDPERVPSIADTTGLAETPGGETWMLGRAGIVGFRKGALDRAFVDRAARLPATILDFQDGLPEVRSLVSQHGAVRGGDGRIWFATAGGVVWIDPDHLVRNGTPPLVHVRSLIAGSARYRDPPVALELPRGTKTVAIRYAGLSLTLPQRVRFRYQLEGVDDGWVDAGSRREAFYANLPAGTHRFRVMAMNNDGVWSRTPATLDIKIAPTFAESIWFKLLVAAWLALLVWAIVRFRTRAVRAGLQARFNARMAEREQIARDLHDTLLQSVQGLILQVQSAIEHLPAGDTARRSVEQALDRADAVLSEGRDQVRALRSDVAPQSLPEALSQAGAAIVQGTGLAFHVSVEGTTRAIRAIVGREMLRIAEEALRNAVRHAGAGRITLRLHYARDELRLAIGDDGSGIAMGILEAGGRAGHYGLLGMRERARQIGAHFDILSTPGQGTEIRLSIAARLAYQDREARLGDRLRTLWRRLGPG